MPPGIPRGVDCFKVYAAFFIGGGEIAEMAEEPEQAEMATKPETEIVEGTQQPTTDTPQSLEALKAEQAATAAALKKANAEAAKYRKQVEALAEAEEKRKDAEMSEMERLQKQLTEAQTKAAQLERQALQRRVASEMGLPDTLATRLQGDDEDAMREDAKAILESLPKPAKPAVSPTNPANGQPATETEAARRARIYSGGQGQTDGFNPATAVQHGGGVVWSDKG